MILLNRTATAAALTLLAAAPLGAQTLYEQDFEGLPQPEQWAPAPLPPEIVSAGGYNGQNRVDLPHETANGTRAVLLDAYGGASPVTTALILDTGVRVKPDTTYTVRFDLAVEGTGSPYEGTFTTAVYAGRPSFTAGTSPSVTTGDAELIDWREDAVGGDGRERPGVALSVTTGRSPGDGFLCVGFSHGVFASDAYAQLEIDNLRVTAEPATTPAEPE